MLKVDGFPDDILTSENAFDFLYRKNHNLPLAKAFETCFLKLKEKKKKRKDSDDFELIDSDGYEAKEAPVIPICDVVGMTLY